MEFGIRSLLALVFMTIPAGLFPTIAAELPQAARGADASFLVVPPAKVAQYFLANTTDLDNSPGGGYSFRYQDDQNRVADVFVYSVIPAEGYRSAGETTQKAVDFEIAAIKFALDVQVGKGVLKKWSRVAEGVEIATVGALKLPGHFLTIEQERNGVFEDSFFRIYVIEGHFIKVRVTEPHGVRSTGEVSAFTSTFLTTMLIVKP
jgi:hypothetical protein